LCKVCKKISINKISQYINQIKVKSYYYSLKNQGLKIKDKMGSKMVQAKVGVFGEVRRISELKAAGGEH